MSKIAGYPVVIIGGVTPIAQPTRVAQGPGVCVRAVWSLLTPPTTANSPAGTSNAAKSPKYAVMQRPFLRYSRPNERREMQAELAGTNQNRF